MRKKFPMYLLIMNLLHSNWTTKVSKLNNKIVVARVFINKQKLYKNVFIKIHNNLWLLQNKNVGLITIFLAASAVILIFY